MVFNAEGVTNLEALRNLRAINGYGSSGYSLWISDNSELTTLAGLRGLRGSLPGALRISDNPALVSISDLDIPGGVEGKDSAGVNVYVRENDALCLSQGDRDRLRSGFGLGWGSRVSGVSRRYEVAQAQAPEGSSCDFTLPPASAPSICWSWLVI